MARQPQGTVTFLFTDIEGSTQRWEHQPQVMPAALARHDALLRQAIEQQGGYVFKTGGDAFCAAFPTAPHALTAALTAQQALQRERWGDVSALRVRMALHTGSAEVRDRDYFGPTLNRVARLLSAGHGGQILLSGATEELVRDQFPPGAALVSLGEHRLKDLIRPEQVFQVVIPDLLNDFPPLKTLDARPTNLPAQPTPLIGRDHEIAVVATLVRRGDVRLVTLTGPGGTGKTRLGTQVAAELLDEFADGVFFVNLAPISDAALVISTIARTLGVTEVGGQPIDDTLKNYLRDKQLLLVLDNFEHILQAALVVADLLAAAPNLKIMVTSRAVLHLRGEHEFPVPPLALPDAKRLPPIKQLTQYDAVRLFIERAQAVKPDFHVTNTNAPAVAEICVRLDGLPLAIELAAARVKLLAPEALLHRLSHRLKLLTSGMRDLPARQQTLRNTIEWSYSLLDDGEQALFRRLAVFVGGGTLEAIEVVCNADGELPIDPFDGVTSLVDKSLLRQENGPEGEPRFVMLETMHEYARERLEASGEAETLRQRHADYFLALAEAAEPQRKGPQQMMWLERLEAEHDNVRTVLQWVLEQHAVEFGLRFAGALWWFWYQHSYLSEGRRWLDAALADARTPTGAVGPAAGTELRAAQAKALRGAGVLAHEQGDYLAARALYEESLAIVRELGDRRSIAYTLNSRGLLATRQGDYLAARAYHEESLAIVRELGDRWNIASPLTNLGIVAYFQGDYLAARALYEESLAIARELGDKLGIANSLNNLGQVAYFQGDYLVARAYFEESLSIKRELGNKRGIATSLGNLGDVTRQQGDYLAARALYEESLAIARELGDKLGIAEALEGITAVAGTQGNAARTLRLAAAATALRAAIGAPLPSEEKTMLDRWLTPARAALDETAQMAAWAEGQAMSLEQAIAYALADDAESRGIGEQ